MEFFEYLLAFNSVDRVLLFIGMLGFALILVILAFYLEYKYDFEGRMTRGLACALEIFSLIFFIGLVFFQEGYYKELRLREIQKIIDSNSKCKF